MQFPHSIQSALLFDRPVTHLENVARTFMKVETAKTGASYNVAGEKPGVYYCLYGADDLMVTLEYINGPADMGVFAQSLGSAVTGLMCADICERVTRHRSHILINVHHGAMGDSPELVAMMATIGRPMEGASLPQFQRRLEACALLSRIAQEDVPASAIHWTQSNQLYPGDAFEVLAQLPVPSPLHVHPYLFDGGQSDDGQALAGIRTFGVRHFIGHEILIEPSVLPWAANFETILAFMRVALTANGYIIPDGDTFGPEDRSLSYRVHHRPAAADDVPLIALEPLMYREFGFQADTYVPKDRVIDDQAPPADILPETSPDRDALMAEWRAKRALAEGVGGQFEVRSRDAGPGGAPPARPVFGRRPIFGRKV